MEKEKRDYFKFFSAISIIGMSAMIVSMTLSLIFFQEQSQFLDTVAIVSFLVFIAPFVLLQLAMSADLITISNYEVNPFWLKVALYSFLFPFTIMFMVLGLNALFEFIPNFYEAMKEGASLATVTEIRQQAQREIWKITLVVYIAVITAGKLLKILKKKPTTA